MKKANAIFATLAVTTLLAVSSTTASMAHGGHGGHGGGRSDDHAGNSGQISDQDSQHTGRDGAWEREIQRTIDHNERDANRNDVAHCQILYRAYDTDSRTFLGHDGHRHSCP